MDRVQSRQIEALIGGIHIRLSSSTAANSNAPFHQQSLSTTGMHIFAQALIDPKQRERRNGSVAGQLSTTRVEYQFRPVDLQNQV
jgi:hypothetical protein